ncbi:MAG: PQQ-binding-like beta-propeller repeat protein, partial [Planctomycetales bacterium]|nr:PQQ-binding-like beta-propeller repeat protein [Planctomycetales bacterium]
LITDDHRQADQRLPQTEFTAEAWVRVDTELEWGGFIGAVQDDGNLERGWLLGFRGLRPSLAVGAQDGPGGITYLTGSDVAFVPRKWHHVAGTYDGKSMKLYLDGKQVATSNEQRGPIRYPDKTFYEIGAYHDGNEYHVFTGALHEVRLYKRALSPQEIDRHFVLKAEQFPPPTAEPPAPPEYRVAVGPWLKFTGPDQAVVRWHTKTPCPTILTWRRDDEHQGRRIEDPSETTEHRVVLRDLKHRRLYYYSIEFADGKEMRSTPEYECDLFFNYVAESRPDAANPNRSWLASQLRRTRGQALVIGAGNEGSVDRLIEQLLEQSEMHLFVVDSDVTKLERYRQRYLESGAYGARIATYQIPSLGRIPVTNHIADFAAWVQPVLKDDLEQACRDVARRLAPKGIGIVAVSKGLASGLDRQSLSDAVGAQVAMMEGDGGLWVCWQAPRLGGSGDWSHAYGRADNSAYGGEMLSGVRNVNDLDVQWIGRPGPRYQADRNGRKNPPIATDDRLFLQGLHRIVTLSAHNGTILWSLEIPYLERYNLPRDCANWSADERNLFATVAKNCLVINAAEGEVENVVSVHDGHEGEEDVEWGYVANDRDLLFGSAVFSGASWLNYVGGPGWYDMTEGEETHPVCSLSLFALDKQSRRRQWCYRGGRILNSTICIAEGRVNFIECREAQVMSSTSSRVGGKEVWEQQFLVTLDARTGDKIAEAPVDTVDGTVAFWMARAEGRLIVVSSADVKYHVYSFDERDGRQQWSVEFAWGKGKADHGSHLSRPAIVGDTLFVRPAVIDLTTGKVTLDAIPVGGCGTYACTAETLIFRAGSGKQLAVWDKNNGDYTRWSRLRPDCWLSTIPAAGMLLSPEGGGGCSCGSWLETSIGFIPKKLLSE